MPLAKPIAYPRTAGRRPNSARRAVRAAAAACVESLETRRLLSTETYFVPTNDGGGAAVTSIQLKPGPSVGLIDVYLNHSGTRSYRFTNLSGTDVVDTGNTGVTLQDLVPAADKFDDSDRNNVVHVNVKFVAGGGGTLEVDAGPNDTYLGLFNSSSAGAAVEVADDADFTTDSMNPLTDGFGDGVDHLLVRTNDAGGATVQFPYLYFSQHLTIDTGNGSGNEIDLGQLAQTPAGARVPSPDDVTLTDAQVVATSGGNTVHMSQWDGTDVDGACTANLDLAGSGNALVVDSGAIATLAATGASHTVVVDGVTLKDTGGTSAPGTVVVATPASLPDVEATAGAGYVEVDAAADIGTFDLGAGATATFTAPSAINTLEGGGTTTFAGGAATSDVVFANANTFGTPNVTVDYGAVVNIGATGGGLSTVKAFVVDGTVTIADSPIAIASLSGAGTGSIEFNGASGSSTIGVAADGGTVTVDSGATVTVGGDGLDPSTFNVLDVAGTTSLKSATTVATLNQTAGLVDLARGDGATWADDPSTVYYAIAAINLTGAATLNLEGQQLDTTASGSTILGYIASAYNGGNWQGDGITSTYSVNTPGTYYIGYATSADNAITGLGLATGHALLRPTTAGDTDLSGTTNYGDYQNLLAGFGHPGDWAKGDTNYDGNVSYADYQILLSAFGKSFPT